MDNYFEDGYNDRQEDVAATLEPVLDIDAGIYLEVDIEYYFKGD